jgi:predicted RNase H-like HicB family nuclease
MEVYKQTDGKWIATIWICRDFYKAEGRTRTEAKAKLKEHLVGIIPILENDIQIAQEKIKFIREFTNG